MMLIVIMTRPETFQKSISGGVDNDRDIKVFKIIFPHISYIILIPHQQNHLLLYFLTEFQKL